MLQKTAPSDAVFLFSLTANLLTTVLVKLPRTDYVAVRELSGNVIQSIVLDGGKGHYFAFAVGVP